MCSKQLDWPISNGYPTLHPWFSQQHLQLVIDRNFIYFQVLCCGVKAYIILFEHCTAESGCMGGASLFFRNTCATNKHLIGLHFTCSSFTLMYIVIKNNLCMYNPSSTGTCGRKAHSALTFCLLAPIAICSFCRNCSSDVLIWCSYIWYVNIPSLLAMHGCKPHNALPCIWTQRPLECPRVGVGSKWKCFHFVWNTLQHVRNIV